MRWNAPLPAAAVSAGPQALIAALRRHIARLEQAIPAFTPARGREAAWSLGIAAADAHLPLQGLERAGLHAIAPQAYGDMPAAMGFAAALALRHFALSPGERRPLLWVRLEPQAREYGRLYGHGFESLGLPRARLVTVTLKRPAEALWTMEEALKSGALALVACDAEPRLLSLVNTRRLVLAAAAGRAAGLLILARADEAALAGHTRWSAAAAASRPPPFDPCRPGDPAWTVSLIRARGGRPGQWHMEWSRAAHRFDLVGGLPDGALPAHADEAGPEAASAGGPALRPR